MSIEQIFDAAAKLGALGLALIGVFALASGRVRVGFLVDADKAEDKADFAVRIQKLETELAEWKALAQGFGPELRRLNDLLDAAIKLLGRTP